MTHVLTTGGKTLPPTKAKVETTIPVKVFSKLDDGTDTDKRGVGSRVLNKLTIYNADTVQTVVSIRINSGTVIRPKNENQILRQEIEANETLIVEDISLAADEQVDIQLSSKPTTNPIECRAEGESV